MTMEKNPKKFQESVSSGTLFSNIGHCLPESLQKVTPDISDLWGVLQKFQEQQFYGTPPIVRSSHPEVFFKKGTYKNFAKITRKHLGQSLFFDKIVG